MLLVEQDQLPCPFFYSPLLQACKTRRTADGQQGLFRRMSGTIQQPLGIIFVQSIPTAGYQRTCSARLPQRLRA